MRYSTEKLPEYVKMNEKEIQTNCACKNTKCRNASGNIAFILTIFHYRFTSLNPIFYYYILFPAPFPPTNKNFLKSLK